MNEYLSLLNPSNWKGLKNGTVFVLSILLNAYFFVSNINGLRSKENDEVNEVIFWVYLVLYIIVFFVVLLAIFKFLVIVDTNETYKDIALASEDGAKKAIEDFSKINRRS